MALKTELKEAAETVEKAEGLWAQYKNVVVAIAGVSFVFGFAIGLLF